MTVNDFCSIAVIAMFVVAVTLFVALIIKINLPPRPTQKKQPAVDVLRTRSLLTMVHKSTEEHITALLIAGVSREA